jgi:ACS family tartrate transporter-like MFS transporter
MVLWSRSLDRRGGAVRHTAIACGVGALGLVAAAYAPSHLLSMVALTVAAVGSVSVLPTFWTLCTLTLGSADAVVGVAVVNSIGNLSGLAGPWLVGLIKGASGEFSHALLALAAGPVVTALLVMRLSRR